MTSNRSSTRRILLGATALAGALALGATQASAQERRYEFDVPAQPLNAALQTFARQAQLQVIFAEAETKSLRAPPLNGSYSADEALQVLLAGTDLKVSRTSKGVLQIAANSDPQSGSAAGDGADQGTVQALIVTAQKREENIQDVPIAMSAFSQEDLTRSQVTGGPDLMTQVPNMTFTKTNFSSYSIQIRGIGTQAISATTDPAVAVAFNNTPFIRNRFFEQEFYDLERVEVLRGPQGTLYGRNATAGVVNIISAKPNFTAEAKLSADVANYSSTRLEGMINIPLVKDAVALRIAGAWTKRDGFVTNQLTGRPIDGRDLWSTRVSLRVSPSSAIDANLIWEHFEEKDDRLRSGKQLCNRDERAQIAGYAVPPVSNDYMLLYNQGCIQGSLYGPESFDSPNGFSLPYFSPLAILSGGIRYAASQESGSTTRERLDPYLSATQSRDLRVIESMVEPQYRADSDVVELQAKFDLTDNLTLTSETGYNFDQYFSLEDFNRFATRSGIFKNPPGTGDPSIPEYPASSYRPGLLTAGPNGGIWCDPQIGCFDRLMAVDDITSRARQFSQEFRLASDFDGPFNFSLGANFLRADSEDKYYVFVNTISLVAANVTSGGSGGTSSAAGLGGVPWINGVSDNHECIGGGIQGQPILPNDKVIQLVEGCQYIDPNPIGSLTDNGHNYFLSKNPYKLISYAAFGEAYYNLADDLKVTAGLRWTVDKKEAPRIPSWLFAKDTIGHPVAEVVDQEWREPTGRLAIDWKPELSFTDATLLYASYAHGYKAGGANPPRSGKVSYIEGPLLSGDVVLEKSATKPKTFDPEFVDAFELGAKNTLFDDHLTLNLAAFYYNYKDYQISQIIDRSATNSNFDSKVWGMEIEADWRPLENLRLGFKGGYENTRIGDGESAVDIMDRANGNKPDKNGVIWVVTRPFPTYTENCIIPLYVLTAFGDGSIQNIGFNTGSPGPCEYAYLNGWDPVTLLPYVANPTQRRGGTLPQIGYIGWDPSTAPNGGEGISKDLSGNELPNAPHFTGTITADYTVPLPNDWLMTLHTDLYYQSEAWTRIFNTPGYDKLKAYTNVNLAAIFTNEDAGWRVMAYIKNVFDRDSITGAFLNSDDTGLTTNVFLTEPRLYGIRVTKEWNGGSWGFGSRSQGPYPLTIELGGVVQKQDAPYDPIALGVSQDAPQPINTRGLQNRDLDATETKSLKVTWRPVGSPWSVSGEARRGEAKSIDKLLDQTVVDTGCPIATSYCDTHPDGLVRPYDWTESSVVNHEEYTLADFTVGRELGIGGMNSKVSAGLRYAQFVSSTHLKGHGVPDWQVPDKYVLTDYSQHHFVNVDVTAHREFEGAGPVLSWDASKTLLGNAASGEVSVDGSVTGGVLFGRQKVRFDGQEVDTYYNAKYGQSFVNSTVGDPVTASAPQARSKSVTVPLAAVTLGLSYEIDRFKVGAGYRWERYFDVLDTGYSEARKADRTMDGPYFKIAVGFGG